jgi:phospholipase C
VVSPFSRGGRVVHEYADHASIVKLIERNWNLSPITPRSRDNLSSPVQHADDPYLPVNAPAIGDLFRSFRFDRDRHDDGRHSNDDDSQSNGGKGGWPF